jgi:hypothetical protein
VARHTAFRFVPSVLAPVSVTATAARPAGEYQARTRCPFDTADGATLLARPPIGTGLPASVVPGATEPCIGAPLVSTT